MPLPVKPNDDAFSVTMHTIVNGWVRNVLGTVAGMLITKGLINAADAANLVAILVPAISGVLVFIGTGLWSTAEKRIIKLLPPPQPLPEGVNPPAG